MARQKSIEEEALLKIVAEYHLENPESKLTVPLIGSYLRSLGYDVKDHTLRRYKAFRTLIDQLNSESQESIYSDLVTYTALDVDDFMLKNNTRAKMRQALMTRDQYYARIAMAGADAIRERRAAEKRMAEMDRRVSELEAEAANVQANVDAKALKEKNKVIVKLREIIDVYIYPEVANAILEKAGLLESVTRVIADDKLNNLMIDTNTDINERRDKSKFQSVSRLFDGFDD